MIKEHYTLRAKGLVKLSFSSQGNILRQSIKQNTILVDAKSIVASRLADIPSSSIDSIKIYNLGLLVASKSIISKSLVSATEIEYVAIFIETDFSGDFDEVRLFCEAIGGFSGLSGIAENKPSNEQLAVTWKIKIL